jgi:hypothetical protein
VRYLLCIYEELGLKRFNYKNENFIKMGLDLMKKVRDWINMGTSIIWKDKYDSMKRRIRKWTGALSAFDFSCGYIYLFPSVS